MMIIRITIIIIMTHLMPMPKETVATMTWARPVNLRGGIGVVMIVMMMIIIIMMIMMMIIIIIMIMMMTATRLR